MLPIPPIKNHTKLSNVGTNTHAQIDTHIAATGTSVHGLGSISTQAANNVSISGGSITGITDMAVADGGTGASDAATARTNLGLVAGGVGDIWVEKAGDTMTGNLVIDNTLPTLELASDAYSKVLFNESGVDVFSLYYDGTGIGDDNKLHIRRELATAANKFTFTAGGRLGIGQETPSYDLDVTGNIRATTAVLTNTISENTTAAGVTIDGVLVKDGLVDTIDVSAHDIATTGIHGVGASTVVGTDLSQTLTNKSINDDSNTITNIDVSTAIKQSTFQNQGFNNILLGGNFESWSAGATSNPDRWSTTGSGSVARDATNYKMDTYSAALTSTGAYSIQQIFNNTNVLAYMSGRTYTFGAWVLTSTASKVRIRICDTAGSEVCTYSSYHTGGGTWEFLTVTRALRSSLTTMRFSMLIDSTGVVANIDGAIAVEGNIVPAFQPNMIPDDGKTLTVDSNNNRVGINDATPDATLDVVGDSLFSDMMNITGGTDADVTGQANNGLGGYLVTGSLTATNISIDNNEIMARNNGAAAQLIINNEGARTYIGGAVGYKTNTVSGNTTLDANYHIVWVNTGTATITLPDPAVVGGGTEYVIIKVGSTAGIITVNATAGNINGASTYLITNQYQGAIFETTGTQWYAIATTSQAWLTTTKEIPHHINKVASANIRNSHDAEITGIVDASFTKKKTIYLPNGLIGQFRIYYDVKVDAGGSLHVRLYRNGVALGSDSAWANTTYNTVFEDITQTCVPGDTLELWAYALVAAGAIKNFRLAYDDSPNVAVASSNTTP